jgi:hypothetical protein
MFTAQHISSFQDGVLTIYYTYTPPAVAIKRLNCKCMNISKQSNIVQVCSFQQQIVQCKVQLTPKEKLVILERLLNSPYQDLYVEQNSYKQICQKKCVSCILASFLCTQLSQQANPELSSQLRWCNKSNRHATNKMNLI